MRSKNESTLALIIPVRNEQQLLPELLQRLHRLKVDEVMIVDGDSDDDSPALSRQSSQAWIVSAPGRSVQMNAGAARCSSEILLFVHADSVIGDANLVALKETMQDESCVGGRFDIALSGGGFAFAVIAWFINMRSRLTGISSGDQCQFVRRSVFEQMGGFPDQPLMEDIEFSKRLKRMGKVAAIRERVITSSRRWEQHGIIRTVLLMWRLRLGYWLGVPAEKLAAQYRQAR